MTTAKTYNGYTNYETWNVALWISNDYGLYCDACEFMRCYEGSNPYEDFIHDCKMDWLHTGDGVEWLGDTLDYAALDEFMREFVE